MKSEDAITRLSLETKFTGLKSKAKSQETLAHTLNLNSDTSSSAVRRRDSNSRSASMAADWSAWRTELALPAACSCPAYKKLKN